ncbi:MAG: cation diffusion facilitator family transporter [Chloroflexota bacterium]
MDEKSKVAALAVFTNIVLTVIKLVVGLMIGSVSVLAEAVHSAVDLLAAVMALFAVRTSARPPDASHPYGHGKVENFTGTIEAVLIFGAAGLIVYEAIEKLFNHTEIASLDAGLAVIGISVVVNFFVSRQLVHVAHETDSVALEADGAHLTTDVVTSLGVFFGLLAVRVTGLTILDPIVALAVAVLICKAAWDVTKHSSLDLFDRSLPEPEQANIKTILDDRTTSDEIMVGYHDLRSRKAGSDKHVDMHVVVHRTASVAEAHELCDDIEQQLSHEAGVRTVVLHVEPCDSDCAVCDGCQAGDSGQSLAEPSSRA